jgi:hypothetical protein
VIPAALAVGFASPSLRPREPEAPAFEIKFLLSEGQAREVEGWATRRLVLDPHGEAALGGAYRTTSLYCDTPELDVYHRTPGYSRRKYRVRRYGTGTSAYLERKSKRGDRVAKQRQAISAEELALLARPVALEDWSGQWFHARLLERRLRPACKIAYHRLAWIGSCPEGPLRLTMDRRIRGMLTDEWDLGSFEGGRPVLAEQVILEFKFLSALPFPFKELMSEMGLVPTPISKYRLCRDAWRRNDGPG